MKVEIGGFEELKEALDSRGGYDPLTVEDFKGMIQDVVDGWIRELKHDGQKDYKY